jgi:hypothetical protein
MRTLSAIVISILENQHLSYPCVGGICLLNRQRGSGCSWTSKCWDTLHLLTGLFMEI